MFLLASFRYNCIQIGKNKPYLTFMESARTAFVFFNSLLPVSADVLYEEFSDWDFLFHWEFGSILWSHIYTIRLNNCIHFHYIKNTFFCFSFLYVNCISIFLLFVLFCFFCYFLLLFFFFFFAVAGAVVFVVVSGRTVSRKPKYGFSSPHTTLLPSSLFVLPSSIHLWF